MVDLVGWELFGKPALQLNLVVKQIQRKEKEKIGANHALR